MTKLPTDPELEAAIFLAEEQVAAGLEQFKLHDPAKDDPRVTVARIYIAMELMREIIEQMMALEMPPVDKSQLN